MPYEFVLKIQCIGAAFESGEPDTGHDNMEYEVARILHDTADLIVKGKLYEKCVRDLNGNICGTVGFQHLTDRQAASRASTLKAKNHFETGGKPRRKR